MFNTAAKLQLGFAAATLVMAVVYAFSADDPAGFVLITGVCVAAVLAALALSGSGFNDRAPVFPAATEAPPLEMVSVERSRVPRPSPWPFVAALATGVLGIGLAVGRPVVIIGIVCGLVAAGGWLAQSWREDASYTRREGSRIAERMLAPVGLPLMAIGLVGVIVISVSRVLLAVPKTASIGLALVMSVALMSAFFALSARPRIGRSTLVLLAGSAVVAVVTAGGVSAASGYRTFEKHAAEGGPETVVAQGTQFKQREIKVTEGSIATIEFKNLDRGTRHNIAVYSSEKGGVPYWNGEPIMGIEKILYTYTFTMPPGTYAFRCDFHANMTGTFTVAAP